MDVAWLLAALAAASPLDAEPHAQAPEHTTPSASVGGGVLGHEPLTGGVGVRGYLNLGEHLRFGPELVAFAPFSEEGARLVGGEASVVVHYLVPVSHPFALYPIAGAGVDAIWEDGRGPHVVPRARVGGGAHLSFARWAPFLEYQLSLPARAEHVVTLGALVHVFGGHGASSGSGGAHD